MEHSCSQFRHFAGLLKRKFLEYHGARYHMESSSAFSPGHVTGFFSIRPHDVSLHHGSLGAGFSVASGVSTRVKRAGQDDYRLNAAPLDSAPVSRQVVELFRKRTGWVTPLAVDHATSLPVGCGFGTSGAGALSLALALNHLAGSPISSAEASDLAHLAEIACGTGLGTVLGESHGGFKVSLVPGAPSVGQVRQLPSPEGLTSVFVVLGPLATPAMLGNPSIRQAVNREGEAFREALLTRPTWKNFLELSVEFGQKTSLVSAELTRWQQRLLTRGWTAPMLMFGNGLFTLVEASDAARAEDDFRELGAGQVFSSLLDRQGGRVMDEH